MMEKLVDSRTNNSTYPAQRNFSTCAYQNTEGQCQVMLTDEKLLKDESTLSDRDNRIKVEIDIDGVVANMFGNDKIKNALASLIPNWSEDLIEDYYMSKLSLLNPKAVEKILYLLETPSYIEELPLYPEVNAALCRLLKSGKVEICFHTLIMCSEACLQARKRWLDRLVSALCAGNDTSVRYVVDFGKKTMFSDSDYVIEDCPGNLEASTASRKILISKTYNLEWSKSHPDVFVVSDLSGAVNLILRESKCFYQSR